VQLIQDETGRVVGAISETPDGEYNKFMAGKGVILASGGFAGSDEMKAYYGRHALGIPTARMPEKNYSGDGIKMALWIGGAFQAGPAAIGAHYNPVQGAGIPFMFVDATGVRFMNEDNPIERIANQDMTLIPGRYHWQVFDNSYADDMLKFYGVFDKELVEPAEGAGVLIKADTLEGLAELMEVPGDVFVEQVKKYNQYVADGKDLQFGKNPDFLTALDEAPFYAIKRVPALLETSGGLDVDLQLRVKDDEGKSISGLYAVGSVAGNCFGPDYPMIMNGASNGRAVTFGMLAGQYAAAENV
jgi:fumarate reductase flavoprotein subunit